MPTFDPSVEYLGPKADIATLTGSPLWGKSVGQVTDWMIGQGFCHRGTERYPTPYGLGPDVQHFETPLGRSIIRTPSYGGVMGKDWNLHRMTEKVFWILWQAGVKVLIIGGTSGTADWRDGDEAIQPGDFVLPWSFRTLACHRGLPGTPFETSWPRHDLLLNDPFCRALVPQQLPAGSGRNTAPNPFGEYTLPRIHGRSWLSLTESPLRLATIS